MLKRFQVLKTPIPEMKVFFIGTYLPQQCGIATFTYDLCQAVGIEIGEDSAGVIAMTNLPEGYDYPEEVVFEIYRDRVQDYWRAAEYINYCDIDLVCLQHEFGIFGGPAGSHILNLLADLKKPVVTTFHTVLRDPEPHYREVLLEIARLSQALVVISRQGEEILREVYGIPAEKIHFIHHGIPDVPFIDPNYYKDKFYVEGRFVLLTSGLLNPNKGVEVVLEALPEVVRRHPQVAYIVLGATHPEIKRRHGEEYRISLQRLARKLGLERHVIFHNQFVELDQLCEFLGACDLYITPYLSREQISSGALAYAVGMGKAVISTPFWYAQEMLADGRGRLVDFRDSPGLAQTIIDLIENEAERHQMRKRAYELGRQMIWPQVGRDYLQCFARVLAQDYLLPSPDGRPVGRRVFPHFSLPEVRLDRLIRLTDDTGLIQHAWYGIPDWRHGYSTDDVGRALMVSLMYHQQFHDPQALSLAEHYLSFLHYMQREDGGFYTFMDYARRVIEEVESEDSFGRALWGLGYAVQAGPTERFRALARELFERSLGQIPRLHHPRGIAYTLCGLYHFLQYYPRATGVRRLLQQAADTLVQQYEEESEGEWRWFHDMLTYSNALMPKALLLAYQDTRKKAYRRVGFQSLHFLTRVLYNGDYFDLIGNDGWYKRGGKRAIFGQQSIDAGYLVAAYLAAYEVTRQERYFQLAQAAFEWFLGRNRLGVSLYDFDSGACADGLDPQGVSLNQGAESAVCFLLALLALHQHQGARKVVLLPAPQAQKEEVLQEFYGDMLVAEPQEE